MSPETPTGKRIDELNNRVRDCEDNLKDYKEDLEECKDVRSDMKVLDERTQNLLTQSKKNGDAIFGSNGTKGILTRLSNLESSMADIKKVGYALLIGVMGVFIELLINLILTHGTALAK